MYATENRYSAYPDNATHYEKHVEFLLHFLNKMPDMENRKQHNDPITYSARGKICGLYQPSKKDFLQGTLLTDDGLKIPAKLTNDIATKLKANRDLLKVAQVWKCYPRINPPWVMLVKLKSEVQTAQELKRKGVNKFCIVGQVKRVEKQKVTVLIKYNRLSLEGGEPTFTLTLLGDLPSNAVGQFWKFNVRRDGWSWNITTANLIASSPESQKEQVSQKKRSLSVKITGKEYQAVEAYAEKYGKNKTEVIRKLIRKLPTFEPDS